MYKVLIVDDEAPARETLQYLITWEDTDFRIVDTAKNGREALEKYKIHRPELIITDIQMPIMDGLTLIKEVKKIDNTQKFIILSCHEEFRYAKEAITMGVTDYLLKDLITSQELHSVLAKVKNVLNEIRLPNTLQRNITSLNDFEEKLFTITKTSAVKSIIFNNILIEDIDEFINKFNLSLRSEYFFILVILIDDFEKHYSDTAKESTEITEKIAIYIQRILDSMGSGECIYNEKNQFIALVPISNFDGELKYITQSHNIIARIREIKLKDKDISFTIGVSRYFYRFKNIFNCYKEALEVTKFRVFAGKGQTLLYNSMLEKVSSQNPETIVETKLSKLEDAIKDNDTRALEILKQLYCQDLKGFMQYNYVKHVNGKIYNMIMKICSEEGITYQYLFNQNYIPIGEIENLETVQEIYTYFANIINRLSNYKRKNACKSYSRRVRDAVEYIELNYGEAISLQTIAEYSDLHKVYLSRLFKEETGQTITSFIFKVRIEKAKEMMKSTNYKIYEIAEMVGFSNPQQFSMIFKRITGKSPAEFREEIN
ncbi:response regulator [Alkaliphilus peptidifermentans]|uniref:Stage 0 sporulation protein A homolog n=1 Tax=Alkaliphilus peptidifermentans DSM 18978 TaxID=1120976 RepID=A0A1G5JMR2_9FIRM|nr:response regulator [Alkaliphilus peptidifermentans]SCY89702.1 two-component system, response regulator YesN [Alkaliphilus peptidifermentans DSM 18978]